MIDILRVLVRRLATLLALAMTWGNLAAVALAAGRYQEPEAKKGVSTGASWTMAYAVTILLIVLGLMVLLRPSGRRDRPKLDQ